MISETTFAKKFTSFWNKTLPNANNYIRLINGGLIEVLYKPLESASRKQNTALVNEVAFDLFRVAIKNNYPSSSIYCKGRFSAIHLKKSLDNSLSYLKRFAYIEDSLLPLSNQELLQTSDIFLNLYDRYSAENVNVHPVFSGCGYINQAAGDIVKDSTLIEIKAGERKFSIYDLRQVLTYLTLNFYSKDQITINTIEFFNPRMGIVFNHKVEDLCKNISALSSFELFSEVYSFITNIDFVNIYGC
ncbi:hypothetical protein ACR9PT_03135 [Piscirickettsia salmonis]|uniref:hypothetical protein n=1 Tax=Piscirickettsia salmonis TaxID=1238 RepID=UPI003EC14B38